MMSEFEADFHQAVADLVVLHRPDVADKLTMADTSELFSKLEEQIVVAEQRDPLPPIGSKWWCGVKQEYVPKEKCAYHAPEMGCGYRAAK